MPAFGPDQITTSDMDVLIRYLKDEYVKERRDKAAHSREYFIRFCNRFRRRSINKLRWVLGAKRSIFDVRRQNPLPPFRGAAFLTVFAALSPLLPRGSRLCPIPVQMPLGTAPGTGSWSPGGTRRGERHNTRAATLNNFRRIVPT